MELFLRRTISMLLRTAKLLHYVRIGLVEHYPICCILHFSWDMAHKRHPARLRGAVYGPRDNRGYVPCRFHMRRHPEWRPFRTEARSQLRLFSDEVGRS